MTEARAVFLDRDGVLNKAVEREGYNLPTSPLSPEELEIFPWVPEALGLLRGMGFLRIMVTNQPDVRKGLITEEKWRLMQSRVEELGFEDIFICRHLKEDGCFCKKPNPGMLLSAAAKYNLDLSRCYLIGDRETDMVAARIAGCISILVMAPYNTGVASSYVTVNLFHAVYLIQELESRGR